MTLALLLVAAICVPRYGKYSELNWTKGSALFRISTPEFITGAAMDFAGVLLRPSHRI